MAREADMVELSEAFLQQFVNGLRESAAAQEASAAAMQQIVKTMERSSDEAARGRDLAVSEVKEHVSSELEQREKWWRSQAIVLRWIVAFGAAAIALAQLFSVPIGRAIEAAAKMHP